MLAYQHCSQRGIYIGCCRVLCSLTTPVLSPRVAGDDSSRWYLPPVLPLAAVPTPPNHSSSTATSFRSQNPPTGCETVPWQEIHNFWLHPLSFSGPLVILMRWWYPAMLITSWPAGRHQLRGSADRLSSATIHDTSGSASLVCKQSLPLFSHPHSHPTTD